ncbi:hypothetical protein DL768_002299 [Monosporascus sp. mg162]|nr:hypothetical protein DL768_002299 [Monosporascus sp. mg162]
MYETSVSDARAIQYPDPLHPARRTHLDSQTTHEWPSLTYRLTAPQAHSEDALQRAYLPTIVPKGTQTYPSIHSLAGAQPPNEELSIQSPPSPTASSSSKAIIPCSPCTAATVPRRTTGSGRSTGRPTELMAPPAEMREVVYV